MVRLLTFLLAFILSGIPATAVVCDLFVCADPAGPAAERCHAHAATAPGTQMSAAQEDCNHLVAAGPYVAATRPASIDPPSTIAGPAMLTAGAARSGDRAQAQQHAPPRLLRIPRGLPLRI